MFLLLNIHRGQLKYFFNFSTFSNFSKSPICPISSRWHLNQRTVIGIVEYLHKLRKYFRRIRALCFGSLCRQKLNCYSTLVSAMFLSLQIIRQSMSERQFYRFAHTLSPICYSTLRSIVNAWNFAISSRFVQLFHHDRN